MKQFKNLKSVGKMNNEKLAMALGLSVLILALANYSSTKSKQMLTQGYTTSSNVSNINAKKLNGNGNGVLGKNKPAHLGNPAAFGSNVIPNAKKVSNPVDLLPKDTNSEWGKLNPQGNGNLENVNLLQAGSLTGINTVGTSLRNANLQIRAEPPNPKMEVGPWQNSTITRDSKYQYGLKVDC